MGNDATEAANRVVACPSGGTPVGKSCDEYPIAKSKEGAASGGPYSLRYVIPEANSSQGGLTTGQDGWMAVTTGMEWGDLDVTVELLTEAPSTVASGWETIAERSLRTTGEAINLLSSTLTLRTALPIPAPGWYTVRVQATGRMSRLPKKHAPGGEEAQDARPQPLRQSSTPAPHWSSNGR